MTILPLALALALVVGLALGLLGGGGSILLLPLLVHVLGMAPKEAITSSLAVVAATSLVGVVGHARSGRVRWSAGAVLGLAGMGGAVAGGLLSPRLPEELLLTLFSLVMLGTGLAMFRRRADRPEDGSRTASLPTMVAVGAAVGFVSGLVGAGGGFLVVPALVLVARLPMRDAVGTSLLVIGLQALAGFASHAGTSAVDVRMVLLVTAAAVTGSLLGLRLAPRVDALALRRIFGVLVLGLGTFLFVHHVSGAVSSLGTFPWLAELGGGALLGLAATLLFRSHGRIAGVSGLFGGLLARGTEDRGLRMAFVLGLVAAGALLLLFAPHALDEATRPAPLVAVAGLLVGYGTRLGNGCTSGHGVCGLSRFSPRSLAATLTFLATGALTVFVVRHLLGGNS